METKGEGMYEGDENVENIINVNDAHLGIPFLCKRNILRSAYTDFSIVPQCEFSAAEAFSCRLQVEIRR